MTTIRPLAEDLQKAACEQLFEKPERIQDDLEALKIWIQQQPHLKARTDDQWLLAFLRGCKFSLEKAKSKLDKFYTLRSKYPDMFTCLDVDEVALREILKLGCMFPLPTPLHGNGPRIMMMRNGLVSPSKYSFEVVGRLLTAIQNIMLLEDDHANVHGMVMVMDMSGTNGSHMIMWSPGNMKKMTVYSEEALPLRPKGSHFYNAPALAEPVFNMIKTMLSKKFQNRIFIHGSKLDKLYEQIPQKYLPKEMGGENSSVPEIIAYWEKKLDEYREYFKDEANYGTNEKLRPGKPIDFENLFGMDGSFRKLDVD